MNWRKPSSFFQRAFWNFNWWQFWSIAKLPTDRGFNTNAHVQLKNQWFLHVGGTIGNLGDVYCDRCARGGPAVRRDQYVAPWFGFGGDSRSAITPSLFVNLFRGDLGRSTSVSASPGVDIRVGSQLSSSIGVNASHRINHTQDLNPITDSLTHYLFAHLDQKEVSLSFRVDYTVTPTLTVQAYAQPFVSKGHWSDVRELSSDPRAPKYDDRFQPYTGPPPSDFNQKFFNSNLVVRWEYRPGSTVYVVWSQGRSDFEPTTGDRNISGDFGKLFDTPPQNTFLIKASYWLNR